MRLIVRTDLQTMGKRLISTDEFMAQAGSWFGVHAAMNILESGKAVETPYARYRLEPCDDLRRVKGVGIG